MVEAAGWFQRPGSDGPDCATVADGPAAAEPRDFTGCRALVVEDNDLSRELLTEFLKDFGFAVEGACDGAEGVRRFSESEPFYYDAVLMDMQMPHMDGDDATRAIRALNRPDADVPIIAQTADALHDGSRRAQAAGMSALIRKPINLQELRFILTELVREH